MINWQWLTFDALPSADLYAVLALRQQVFVLEQQCLYQDLDGHDQAAHHLLGWQIVDGQCSDEEHGDGKRQLAAYLRCLAPGAKYAEMSLGRVLTAPSARAALQHPGHATRIGAQHYLERFYQSFGFATVSAPYDEDGIAHIDMLRAAS